VGGELTAQSAAIWRFAGLRRVKDMGRVPHQDMHHVRTMSSTTVRYRCRCRETRSSNFYRFRKVVTERFHGCHNPRLPPADPGPISARLRHPVSSQAAECCRVVPVCCRSSASRWARTTLANHASLNGIDSKLRNSIFIFPTNNVITGHRQASRCSAQESELCKRQNRNLSRPFDEER